MDFFKIHLLDIQFRARLFFQCLSMSSIFYNPTSLWVPTGEFRSMSPASRIFDFTLAILLRLFYFLSFIILFLSYYVSRAPTYDCSLMRRKVILLRSNTSRETFTSLTTRTSLAMAATVQRSFVSAPSMTIFRRLKVSNKYIRPFCMFFHTTELAKICIRVHSTYLLFLYINRVIA